MSDLQATIEFSVELCKFYNVDLFQRGLYQVRTVLRASPKLPVQVEASIPDSGSSASVLGQGTGASRTFQILYRNEEVTLRDVVHYRAHLLVDSRHIKESLKRAEFTIIVELWFSEQSMNGASYNSGLTQVSSRTLQLNFCPMKGLHYHLPVLFDYFHLAAVSLTVHANLVALHQPYIKTNCVAPLNFTSTPRSGKPWLNKNPSRITSQGSSTSQSTMETVLIGSVKCGGNSTKIAHARQVHQEVCSLLLSSLEALRNTIMEYSTVLPYWQQLPPETGQGQAHVDSAQRLRKIADLAKFMDSEDDFLARANSDIAQLCAENILQWRHFLEAASQPLIHQLLAKKHHQLRVKRFAEAFFVLVNPRHSAAGCYDANHQYYLSVTELARTRYLPGLPPLPIHCAALDGDPSNIPIIFEDQYEDNVEFTRRRSGGGSRRADSEPFLSAVVSETQPPAPKDCSCGISAILEARSPRTVTGNGCNPNTSPLAALMEPRIVVGGDVLQASISIAPQVAQYRNCKTSECERKATQRGNIQNNRSLSRYSASTLLDIVANQEPGYLPVEPPCIGASNTLPARHSKSLDQLKCPNGAINGVIVNTTLPRALPQYTTRPQAEDLMKNITEFREKYKNPGDVHNNPVERCHRNDRIPSNTIRIETTPRYNTVDRVVRCNPNKEFDYCLSTLPRQHGLPPRNSYPPIRVKKQYSDTTAEIVEHTVMNGATRRTNIPRSSSTQFLRNNCREWEIATPQSSIPDCVPCRTKHTKHSRTRAYKSHGQTDISEPGSSSSDSDSINRKKLGASASVPFRLEALEVEVSNSNSSNPVAFSESLPNLAPPPAFESSPIRKHSTSESTSSLSEQSGWVSSRRSSAPSSPELPRRFESRKFNTLLNGTKDPTVLNGDQLRKKLEQLATNERFREVPKSKVDRPIYGVIQSNGSVAVMSTSSSRSQPARSKDVKVTSSRRREEYCWNSNGHFTSTLNETPNRQTRSKSSHYHEPDSKVKPLETRITNEINRIMMETPLTDKAKSEFDLTLMDHSYEEVRLPPPQQFRDVPPPPDEFRDPPPNNPETIQLPISIDNPLYHVYESVNRCRERPVIKSQSSNELTAMVNVAQPRPLSATPKQNAKIDSQMNSRSKLKNGNQTLNLDAELDTTASVIFSKSRDDFKRQMNYSGEMYSDRNTFASELPYFHISDEYRMFSPAGVHLIVCVHGLDGNSADLRLVKTYLELGLPGAHLEFLMSERNQGDTFSDFDTMTDRLVGEILYHIEALGLNPTRISFVGHSLGTIIVRSALARPQMRPLLSRLHTFLSLSGPHLGTLYNSSGLVNMGMWFMQKWKKSGSLLQLCLRDAADVRQSFLYRLSQRSTLHRFRHVLLCGSSQDRYVPLHSARLELCKAAVRDVSPLGTAYREMVHNIVAPMLARRDLTLARFDAHHALPHTANALIGRAAHIAVLDSELFLEKFLLVAALKYFS